MLKRTLIGAALSAALVFPFIAKADDTASRPTSRPSSRPASQPTESSESFQAQFAKAVEAAHGGQNWLKPQIFEADFSLALGKSNLKARLIMDTSSARTRLEFEGGTTLGFDGRDAWISPKDASMKRGRFHALTWSYFVAAPFKLRDPGSHLADEKELKLGTKAHEAAKLTFDPGVGDAPEDWYMAYRDPKTKSLEALAYIVTYGKGKPKGPVTPHAISYHDFKTISGARIASSWKFWNWSKEKGFVGEAIGHGTLKKMRFVKLDRSRFEKPETGRTLAKP